MAASYDEKTLRDWIDRCLNEAPNLSKWERDFCTSLSDQLDRSGTLSPKQQEILERIYVDKVS